MEEKLKVDLGIADVVDVVKDTETIKEVDKTGALFLRAVRAPLSPLEIWVMNRENHIERTRVLLTNKLKDVPVENIITPPQYIGVPALQALSYCMEDNELREMYAELLKTAMNSETVDNVHPTYVEIVKQMSPYDAVIFKKLINVLVKPCIGISYKNKETGAAYPIQDIVAFEDIEKYPLVPTQIALENLERLGLIEINRRSKYVDNSAYEGIIKCMNKTVCKFVEDNAENLRPDEYQVSYEKYTIIIRGFGQFFARACLGADFSHIT